MKIDKVASNIKELIKNLDGQHSEIIKEWSFAQNEDGTWKNDFIQVSYKKGYFEPVFLCHWLK